MSNKTTLIIVSISVVVVGLVAFLVWLQIRTNSESNQASPGLINFAKCLTSKGIKMYGTDSCYWSQKQKALFKSAWQYVDYVNCVKDPNACVAQNIQGTPTWIFTQNNNKKSEGYQELNILSQESGCPLELNKQ